MEETFTLKELQRMASECVGSVLYIPTKSEVDYKDPSFPLEINKVNIVTIPKDKNSDPFKWVNICMAKFKNDPVCVLVPGTRFDAYGTRHGKGGGWYDRFLSKIPSSWLRVGIIDVAKFSSSKLTIQEWDEPVNWIIVRDAFSWSVYKVSGPPHRP